jgi:hypothetical protein
MDSSCSQGRKSQRVSHTRDHTAPCNRHHDTCTHTHTHTHTHTQTFTQFRSLVYPSPASHTHTHTCTRTCAHLHVVLEECGARRGQEVHIRVVEDLGGGLSVVLSGWGQVCCVKGPEGYSKCVRGMYGPCGRRRPQRGRLRWPARQ